jgi:hypothetical protein
MANCQHSNQDRIRLFDFREPLLRLIRESLLRLIKRRDEERVRLFNRRDLVCSDDDPGVESRTSSGRLFFSAKSNHAWAILNSPKLMIASLVCSAKRTHLTARSSYMFLDMAFSHTTVLPHQRPFLER